MRRLFVVGSLALVLVCVATGSARGHEALSRRKQVPAAPVPAALPRGCVTPRVDPSLQIERFVSDPPRFARALRTTLRRPPADLLRTSRADVAEIRVTAEDTCAMVLTPEATERFVTWSRALAAMESRGALIVRTAHGPPRAIEELGTIATGVLPIACDALARAPLCAADRGALAVQTVPGLGVQIDTPNGWSWRASPTGLALLDPSGVERDLRVTQRPSGPLPIEGHTIQLETGSLYGRAGRGRDARVFVALTRPEGSVLCTSAEELGDLCASLRPLSP